MLLTVSTREADECLPCAVKFVGLATSGRRADEGLVEAESHAGGLGAELSSLFSVWLP